MKHRIIGDWSVRAFVTEGDRTGYHIYPAGERSHWSIKGTLWPATDGTSFVISMNRRSLDARPSLDAALNHVIGILDEALAKSHGKSLQPPLDATHLERSAT